MDVALSSGHVRTGKADTVVARIELWLDSDLAENLRSSLGTDAYAVRHAVLVFDAQTEAEYVTASELGLEFRPSRRLTLPQEIDVLWFVLGPVACRFDPTDGWRTVAAPLIADSASSGDGASESR